VFRHAQCHIGALHQIEDQNGSMLAIEVICLSLA